MADQHVKISVDRETVTEFLYREARLLDEWRLDEWLDLFVQESGLEAYVYVIPPLELEPEEALEVDPGTVISLVADDFDLLRARVRRLNNIRAHAENPRSRTRHLVSNILISSAHGDELTVDAAFVVFRWRFDALDSFVGQYRYRLLVTGSGLKIREKRVVLDLESIEPMSSIGIIL